MKLSLNVPLYFMLEVAANCVAALSENRIHSLDVSWCILCIVPNLLHITSMIPSRSLQSRFAKDIFLFSIFRLFFVSLCLLRFVRFRFAYDFKFFASKRNKRKKLHFSLRSEKFLLHFRFVSLRTENERRTLHAPTHWHTKPNHIPGCPIFAIRSLSWELGRGVCQGLEGALTQHPNIQDGTIEIIDNLEKILNISADV
jgi:hypothetical protein